MKQHCNKILIVVILMCSGAFLSAQDTTISIVLYELLIEKQNDYRELEQKNRDLTNDISTLNRKINDLEAKTRQDSIKKENLKRSKATAREDFNNIKPLLEQAQRDNKNYRRQIKQLEQDKIDLNQQLRTLESQQQQTNEDFEKLKDQTGKDQRALEELDGTITKNNQLSAELGQKKRKIKALEDQIDEMKRKVSSQERELKELRPLKESNNQLIQDKNALARSNGELEQKVEELESDLATAREANQKFVGLQDKLTRELYQQSNTFLSGNKFYGQQSTIDDLKDQAELLKSVQASNDLNRISNRLSEFQNIINIFQQAKSQLDKAYDTSQVNGVLARLQGIKDPSYNTYVAREKSRLLGLLNGYKNVYSETYYFMKDINDYSRPKDAEDAIRLYMNSTKLNKNDYPYLVKKLDEIKNNASINVRGKRLIIKSVD